MKKLSRKKTTGLLAGALAVSAMAGTFAFFTDYVSEQATIKTYDETGVDIETDPNDPNPDYRDDLTAKWTGVNADVLANFNPGDKVDLSYTLANVGELAVDVRETFIVTSSVDMKETPEFRLFNAAEADANGANTGVGIVAKEERLSPKQYKYTVAPYSMSSETIAIDGAPSSIEKTYQLVYDKISGNNTQAADCTIDYVIEVKQHTKGGEADWVVAATGTLDLAGQSLNVVPANK